MGYFVKIFEFKQQNNECPKICRSSENKGYVQPHFTAFKDKDKELKIVFFLYKQSKFRSNK